MRVMLCKIQCPSFDCFCKPSPHIYAASPLKSENTTQVSSSITVSVDDDHDAHVEEDVDHVDGLLNEEVREEDCAVVEKKESHSNVEILKSSLKKAVLDLADGGTREKKKVQWVDMMGKDLAEIREFESSEEDDIRYDDDKACCVIL